MEIIRLVFFSALKTEWKRMEIEVVAFESMSDSVGHSNKVDLICLFIPSYLSVDSKVEFTLSLTLKNLCYSKYKLSNVL